MYREIINKTVSGTFWSRKFQPLLLAPDCISVFQDSFLLSFNAVLNCRFKLPF